MDLQVDYAPAPQDGHFCPSLLTREGRTEMSVLRGVGNLKVNKRGYFFFSSFFSSLFSFGQ